MGDRRIIKTESSRKVPVAGGVELTLHANTSRLTLPSANINFVRMRPSSVTARDAGGQVYDFRIRDRTRLMQQAIAMMAACLALLLLAAKRL